MPNYPNIKAEFQVGKDVMDTDQMLESSAELYSNYIQTDIFSLDHRGILRATHGQYPIATTQEQIDLLISYLQQTKHLIAVSD